MKKFIISFTILLAFTACELLEPERNEEEDRYRPIHGKPEITLKSVDPYRFSLSWTELEDADFYEITWRHFNRYSGTIHDMITSQVVENEYSTDTWRREGAMLYNPVYMCGNMIHVSVSGYNHYMSEKVYSQEGVLEFIVPHCEFELETSGPTEFQICEQEEDYEWYFPTIIVKNLTYESYETVSCHPNENHPCVDKKFQIIRSFESDNQDYANQHYKSPFYLQDIQVITGIPGTSGSIGFLKSAVCRKGTQYLKLKYTLKDVELEEDINTVAFNFLFY